MADTFFSDNLGFDLDQLFEPIDVGDTPVAATKFEVNTGSPGSPVWTDLSALYAPLSIGSAIDHSTKFEVNTGSPGSPVWTDLSALYAAKGSRSGTLTAAIPGLIICRDQAPQDSGDSGLKHCSASGGVPPYSYLWTVLDGDVTIHVATSADASFSMPSTAEGNPGHVKCTVTDSASTVVDSNHAVVSYFFFNPV